MENRLIGLQQVLKKYGIKYRINISSLMDYHREKEFHNFDHTIVETSEQKYWDVEERDFGYYNAEGEYVDSLVAYNYSTSEVKLLKELMFFESYELDKLNDNFNLLSSEDKNSEVFYAFVFIAFFLSSFIVWFEFAEIKSWLLTIPIGGGIAILIAMIMMGFNSVNYQGKFANQTFLFIQLALIAILSVYWIFNSKSNRFAASIGLNLTYILSHGLLFLGLWVVNGVTEQIVFIPETKCSGGYETTKVLLPYVETPLTFLICATVSVFLFYLLVPIWKAKKS